MAHIQIQDLSFSYPTAKERESQREVSLTTDAPRRFFGGNSFYTTAAGRMSRYVIDLAVTPEDVIHLYRQNREAQA